MKKRLNNLHYVVFCLVLLVLIIGTISVVRAPANDFAGHIASQILNVQGISIDANNNGIIDKSQSLQVYNQNSILEGAEIYAEVDPNNNENVLLKSNDRSVVLESNDGGSVNVFKINNECILAYVESNALNCPNAPYINKVAVVSSNFISGDGYVWRRLSSGDINQEGFFICCK